MATTPAPKKPAAKKPSAKATKPPVADNDPFLTDAFEADLAPVPVEVSPFKSSFGARLSAEFFGTFVLMLVGLGIAAMWGIFNSDSNAFTPLFSAIGFGFAVTALAVALGAISGAHLNPAVTLGFWGAGRFPGRDVVAYIVAQTAGAAAAVLAIWAALHSHPGIDTGLDSPTSPKLIDTFSIGWGEMSPRAFGLATAIVVEIILTALLVALVLFATARTASLGQAPFTIGLGLTVLVLLGAPFTNASLNPARATSTWIFGSEHQLNQLWPWWVTGIVAGLATGLLFRLFAPEDEPADAE